MSGFRRVYGAGPLHLLAVAATGAIAAYALARIFAVVGDPWRVVTWIGAAIVAHDLILFPAYALVGVLGAAILSRPALNHLRAPLLLSGLLLLVWFPLVSAQAPRTFMRVTGLDVHVYSERWLLLSAALLASSALLLVTRPLRRARAGRRRWHNRP